MFCQNKLFIIFCRKMLCFFLVFHATNVTLFYFSILFIYSKMFFFILAKKIVLFFISSSLLHQKNIYLYIMLKIIQYLLCFYLTLCILNSTYVIVKKS